MNAFPDQNLQLTPDPLTADHLTPDQIDDHLIGDLVPSASAHLAACSLCAERVAAAASPLASFQKVSNAWSERRSATLPIPVPTPQRPVWQRHTAWATASLSLAFGVAMINATHQFPFSSKLQPTPTRSVQQPDPAPVAASIVPAPQSNEISADNHMLRAIDASLDPSTDSPATLGLTPATAAPHGPPALL